jgi:hypothetical protein
VKNRCARRSSLSSGFLATTQRRGAGARRYDPIMNMSEVITLYLTPVVYTYMAAIGRAGRAERAGGAGRAGAETAEPDGGCLNPA